MQQSSRTLKDNFHYGIDLGASGEVTPTESGEIVKISVDKVGYGISVMVKDTENHVWRYGHLFEGKQCVDAILKNSGGAKIRSKCNEWLIFIK